MVCSLSLSLIYLLSLPPVFSSFPSTSEFSSEFPSFTAVPDGRLSGAVSGSGSLSVGGMLLSGMNFHLEASHFPSSSYAPLGQGFHSSDVRVHFSPPGFPPIPQHSVPSHFSVPLSQGLVFGSVLPHAAVSAPSIPVVTLAPYTWPLVHPYPPASAPLPQIPSASVSFTQNVQGSSFPPGSVHWGSFSGSGLQFGHGSSHSVPDPNFRNTPFGQSFAN